MKYVAAFTLCSLVCGQLLATVNGARESFDANKLTVVPNLIYRVLPNTIQIQLRDESRPWTEQKIASFDRTWTPSSAVSEAKYFATLYEIMQARQAANHDVSIVIAKDGADFSIQLSSEQRGQIILVEPAQIKIISDEAAVLTYGDGRSSIDLLGNFLGFFPNNPVHMTRDFEKEEMKRCFLLLRAMATAAQVPGSKIKITLAKDHKGFVFEAVPPTQK